MFVVKIVRQDASEHFLRCDKYGTYESMRLVPNPWEATPIELRNTANEFCERSEGFYRAKAQTIAVKDIAMIPPEKCQA